MAQLPGGNSSVAALYHLPAHLRFWAMALLGALADLMSKYWACDRLGDPKDGTVITVIPNLLLFHTSYNRGAVFGLGQDRVALFIAASILALLVVLYVFFSSLSRQWLLHLSLGAIMAGALGNLYDRLQFGYVRDFIHLKIDLLGREWWPYVFNVADTLLCIGVGILFMVLLRCDNEKGNPVRNSG